MIDRSLRWFWTRAGDAVAVPAKSLVVFRWIFGIYLLLFDAPYFAWIERTPAGFFDPPLISIANLFDSFPSAPFFLVLDIVSIVALCAMIVGYRTFLSTLVVIVTRVIGTSFSYSYGKISHQIALSAILICMLIADWSNDGGRERSNEAADEAALRRRRGLALFGVILAFGFLTAGEAKFRNWINLDLTKSGFLSWFYPNYLPLDRDALLANWVPGIPIVLLKLADVAASLFEMVGFLFLLGGRKAWRLWLVAAALFHLGNALFLNISFTSQAVCYLAFVDWSSLYREGWRRFRNPAFAAVSLIGLWHIGVRLMGRGSPYFLMDGTTSTFVYDLVVSLIVCVVVAAVLIRDAIVRSSDLERRPVPV